MFPGGIGTGELVIIGALAVILFGSKLPDVARNFGKSYQQFRKGLSEIQTSFSTDVNSPPSRSNNSNSNRERIKHYKDATDDPAPPVVPRFEAPAAESPISDSTDSVSP
jgi:sec-independent protein translocase protein TatA